MDALDKKTMYKGVGKLIVGLDMGGTNIDGVIIDKGKVIKSIKKPTDRNNLFQSIWGALKDLLANVDRTKISRINLSTTISTNAIVENKTSPVAMIIQSGPGIANEFLACGDENIFISGYIDHRGKIIESYQQTEIENAVYIFKQEKIKSAAVVTKFSTRNPEFEKSIKSSLEESFDPITMGHSLSGKLNFPRRVYTSYLNSAVYQILNDFTKHIKNSLEKEGVDAPVFLLKADGGTMNIATAEEKPVETILSGPAASFMGISAMLPTEKDAILLDIGGTTTDIFFLADGIPLFEPLGIKIGKYKTLVRAIYSQSIGLGGDSSIKILDGRLSIGPKREGRPFAFGGPLPTPTDAMILLKKINKNHLLPYLEKNKSVLQYNQLESRAYKAMEGLANQLSLSPIDMAKLVLDTMGDIIKDKVNEILKEVNSKPVYTIKEFLEGKKLKAKLINIIGGPARVLGPLLENKFNLPCKYPENYHVANAVGAALSKPTAEINMLADTSQGVLSVPEMEIYEKVGRNYSIDKAKNRALELVKRHALAMGAREKELKAEITEESTFNMVKGFYTSGKNIRVKAQIKPGLIQEYRGDIND